MKRYRLYGELAVLLIPIDPWREIIIDFIIDLPPSKRNGIIYNAILVVIDRYTKMACYLPIASVGLGVSGSQDLGEIAGLYAICA